MDGGNYVNARTNGSFTAVNDRFTLMNHAMQVSNRVLQRSIRSADVPN